MKAWVLIVIINNAGIPAVSMQAFLTQSTCEAAAVSVQNNTGGVAYCVKK